MKKILFVIFTMILFFFVIRTTYAVETIQTNPLIEFLNIFLNFGNSVGKSTGNAPASNANLSPKLPPPTTNDNGLTAFFPDPLLPISNNVTTAEKNAVL